MKSGKLRDVSDAALVLNSIRRLVRSLRVHSREVEQRSGLSAAQLFVLQILQESAPLSLKELRQRTFTDLSSVSVVVERLAQKELLQRRRSAKDGRVLELWLSSKGKALLRQQPDAMQSRMIRSVEKMSSEGRLAFRQGFENFLTGAGLADEEPEMLFESGVS